MMKYVDAAVCYGAGVAFDTIQYFNRFNPNPAVHPEMDREAAAEVLAKDQAGARLAAANGFALPRVRQGSARSDHRRNKPTGRRLLHEKVGEIKAQIIERDGQVWMVKDCPQHGNTEDLMAIDVEVPGVDREELPRPRHSGPQRRRSSQSRQQHRSNTAAALF